MTSDSIYFRGQTDIYPRDELQISQDNFNSSEERCSNARRNPRASTQLPTSFANIFGEKEGMREEGKKKIK